MRTRISRPKARFAAALLLASLAALPALAQGRHIYPDSADANADIHAAILQATREHKNILLDFGGDWCGECQVLDIYFHQPPNAELLASNFVVVYINVGHLDQNMAIAQRYRVAANRGVPALGVLDSRGHLLYGQPPHEGEEMVRVDPATITVFLNRWKPKR